MHVVLFVRQLDDRNGSEAKQRVRSQIDINDVLSCCAVLQCCCLLAALEDSVTRACENPQNILLRLENIVHDLLKPKQHTLHFCRTDK